MGESTLQGTNISPQWGILKVIFLFPRWDMLISCRASPTNPVHLASHSSRGHSKYLFSKGEIHPKMPRKIQGVEVINLRNLHRFMFKQGRCCSNSFSTIIVDELLQNSSTMIGRKHKMLDKHIDNKLEIFPVSYDL